MSDNKDLPVYFPLTQDREILLRSDVIARYSVGVNPDQLVLATKSGMAYIEAGETPWQLSFAKNVCITPEQSADRVVVEATWFSAEQAQEAGIKVVAGSNANTFAGLGALLVPDGFSIPAVVATPENVKFYGVKLLAKGEVFTVSSAHDMALIEYEYKPNYREDFLTQTTGGGGFFVERHNFPHLHIPLDSQCGGYIIIGKQMTKTSFAFTAFNIPHEHAFYTPPNTIHGDGTLIGSHAISIAKSSIKADTVLVYNKNTISKADDIVPFWPG